MTITFHWTRCVRADSRPGADRVQRGVCVCVLTGVYPLVPPLGTTGFLGGK